MSLQAAAGQSAVYGHGHGGASDVEAQRQSAAGAPPRRPKPTTLGQRASAVFRKLYKKLGLKHFIALLLVAIYTLIGGGLFQLTEYSHNVAVKQAAYDEWQLHRRKLLSAIAGQLEIDQAAADERRRMEQIIRQVIGRMHEVAEEKHPTAFHATYAMKRIIKWFDEETGKLEEEKTRAKRQITLETTPATALQSAQTGAVAVPEQNTTLSPAEQFLENAMAEYEENTGFVLDVDPVWHFWNALYFAATLYTTIGYGNIACSTTSGQVATMIYALIGIPLVLSAMNDISKWLFQMVNNFMAVWEDFTKACAYNWQAIMSPDVPQGQAEALAKAKENRDRRQKERQERRAAEAKAKRNKEEYELMMGTGFTADGETSKINIDTDHMDELASSHTDDNDDDLEELLEEERQEPPHIPVKVALIMTIGWIFMCAGMFCLWEDWTFFTSFYFFVISLSTIGLGDVTPARTDYMVSCMLFVIVGLALVTMCINVIQQALEDLYIKLLMKILLEYQKKLAEGGDQVGATMDMMNMWNDSIAARLLMPMLGSSKKAMMAEKFEKTAKEQGIELPPVLTNLDPKTGMPSILTARNNKTDTIQTAILEAETVAVSAAPAQVREPSIVAMPVPMPEPTPPPTIPSVVMYDGDTQTELVTLAEVGEQTYQVDVCEMVMQTDLSMWGCTTDEYTQTTWYSVNDAEIQTTPADTAENDTQTAEVSTDDVITQTELRSTAEKELQTHLFDTNECEAQTEPVNTTNIRVQTPQPEFSNVGTMTERVKKRKSIVLAHRRRHSRSRTRSPTASVRSSSKSNSDAEDEEKETIIWDPVDGLHAEKQRAVSDLRKMFGSMMANPAAAASQPGASPGAVRGRGGLTPRGGPAGSGLTRAGTVTARKSAVATGPGDAVSASTRDVRKTSMAERSRPIGSLTSLDSKGERFRSDTIGKRPESGPDAFKGSTSSAAPGIRVPVPPLQSMLRGLRLPPGGREEEHQRCRFRYRSVE